MGVVVLLLCLAVSAYVGVLLTRKVATALKTGTLQNGNTIYVREDDPISFWFNISVFVAALMVITGFWLAILSLSLQ